MPYLLYYRIRGPKMAIKLTLTSEELLDKKFAASPRGYNPLEVDQYLDLVLRDYRLIEQNCLVEKKEIERLNETIKELEKKINALEIENVKYQKRFEDIKDNKNITIDNMDLYKRISALEKALYRLGINPQTIK